MTSTEEIPVFCYETDAARDAYERTGWFHGQGGVNPSVMDMIVEQISTLMGSSSADLADWQYPEKKEQFLWELPTQVSIDELCKTVALTTGMNPATTVLSERHLKVYSATAADFPPPHKDRSASTVTVGIGIDGPTDSRLVMWPETETTYNPFPTAAGWRNSRHPDELPEVVTAGKPSIEIDLRPGDVVLFRGANFYHERHRPACTTVLYLKFNDRGLDPLGEDPRTVEAEARSLGLEERLGDSSGLEAFVSPRLIAIRSDDYLPDLGTVLTAQTMDAEHGIRLTAEEADLLRDLSQLGPTTVGRLSCGEELLGRLIRLQLVLLR